MKRFAVLVLSFCLSLTLLFGCSGGVSYTSDNEIAAVTFAKTIFGDLYITGNLYGYGENASDLDGVRNEVYTLLDTLDKSVSTKNENSGVYKFNHNEGGIADSDGWVRYPIDRHAYAMLQNAQTLNEATNGYFDPTVYPLMKVWGLRTGEWNDKAFHAALPKLSEIEEAKSHCGLDKIAVTEKDGMFYVAKQDPLAMIDLGAQAKGYAADRIREILDKAPQVYSSLYSLSGNVYATGKFPIVADRTENGVKRHYLKDSEDFNTGILDPFLADSVMPPALLGFPVRGEDASVVTSGDYIRRYYWVNGEYVLYPRDLDPNDRVTEFCHIIDPKTGYPCNVNAITSYPSSANPYENVEKDRLTSVTIVNESSECADVYATAVMLMGMTEGVAWMQSNDIEGFLIGKDGQYADLLDAPVLTDRKDGYSFSLYDFTPFEGLGI